MDGWKPLLLIGGVTFWSRGRLCAVNASLCHIWTVVSMSNSMMNRSKCEERKAGGWISLCRSAACSYRQINICRHSYRQHSCQDGQMVATAKATSGPHTTPHTLLDKNMYSLPYLVLSAPLIQTHSERTNAQVKVNKRSLWILWVTKQQPLSAFTPQLSPYRANPSS